MEKQNEKQIEFLKSLMVSLHYALKMNENLLHALEIGGAVNEQAAFDYLKALTVFMDAGMKIIWTTHFSYGENSKTVAEKTLNRTDINN